MIGGGGGVGDFFFCFFCFLMGFVVAAAAAVDFFFARLFVEVPCPCATLAVAPAPVAFFNRTCFYNGRGDRETHRVRQRGLIAHHCLWSAKSRSCAYIRGGKSRMCRSCLRVFQFCGRASRLLNLRDQLSKRSPFLSFPYVCPEPVLVKRSSAH